MADESLTWDLRLEADTGGATKVDAALGKISEHVKDAHGKMGDFEHGARDGFGRAGKHAEDFSHKVRYEFGTLGHSFQYAKHELKDLAEAFGMYEAFEAIKRLGEKVIEIGEDLFETAAKAERFDASFKLALGAEPGGQILEYIEKIGHHTEFTQEQLKGMNLELAKSGFKGAGLARGTEAAIDLAAMSSNPQEGANSAIEALRRIQTTGRLQARALMPFGISEKQLYAELSTETGLGLASVKKKLEAGTLDIDTTLNSLYTVITKKTGKALGGAGADMENLFSTRLKNLKEIPDLLYEKMSKSKGFATISEWIGKIGDQFGVAGAQGSKILEALTDEVNRFGNALGDVDAGDLGSTISDVVHLVGTLAAGTVVLIDDVASGIQRLERGYLRIKAAFGGDEAKKEYGKFILDEQRADRAKAIENSLEAKAGDRDLAELDKKGGEFQRGPTEDVGYVLNGVFHRAGEDAAGSLAAGLNGGKGQAEDAGAAVGTAVERGTRKALKMHSPSRVMEDLADLTVDSFADRVRASAAQADAAVAGVVARPGRAGGGMGSAQISVAPHIVVNAAPGMSAEEVGSIAAEKVIQLTPGALQSALEQLAMQTGAAA